MSMIIQKARNGSKHEMKALILVFLIMSGLLFSCQSSTTSDIPQQVSQTQSNNITTSELPTSEVNQDLPGYSKEEIFSLILNCLPGILPNDYTIEQFATNTKSAQYIGEGKWDFSILGSGSDKVRMPEEKTIISDAIWTYYRKEQETKFDLRLAANYYEDMNLCEIQSIEKYNVVTETTIISERQIRAELLVYLIQIDKVSAYHNIVRFNVRNTSKIPIKGIRMQISYNSPKAVNYEKEVYEGTLNFDQTAILKIEFEDILNYPIPDEYHFFTKSGEPIYYQEKPGWDQLPDVPITTEPKSGY